MLVACNLLCWIPIQSILVYSLSGGQIESRAINLFVILVLPLNSFTNPFLYTIKSLKRKGKAANSTMNMYK